MDKVKTYYTKRIEHYSELKKELEVRSKHFSILRLICFLVLGVSIYQCFVTNYLLVQIILSVLFLVFFLWLIKKHDKIMRRRDWAGHMLMINNNELATLDGKPSAFDNGISFFSTSDYYYDLDIFGEKSVYHMLNRTGTHIGNEALVNRLKNPILEVNKIRQQQNAIKDLTEKPEFRQKILATALGDKGKVSDLKNVENWINNSTKLSKRWWKYVLLIAPLLFLASVVYAVVTGNPYIAALVFVINLGICYYLSKGIGEVHEQLNGAGKLLNQYAKIFAIIGNEDFTSTTLSQIHSISNNASRRLKSLSSIINYFDQRANMLVALIFNPIFFYDLHCIVQLEKWKKRNTADIGEWFNSIANIEVFNSFATFAYNNPQYCVPQITSGEQIIQAKDLAHPLILANKRISNDVDFGTNTRRKVILITGSNMSGKSTFLRTIGVNMLLASCGSVVCASEFSFYPVHLYTSLRQSDSLQEDTSFFYAELKKLSEIVKHLESGEQAIVLLDEVLKGTNSDDKTYGSQELIRRLVHFDSLSLIATHDVTLGKMEKEYNGSIENYCFESTIENNELLFDYKLHKGIAINKNATFLMKKMGIIDTKPDND